MDSFKYSDRVRWAAFLLIIGVQFSSSVIASEIDFEDAFLVLGQASMPEDFYSSNEGLTIAGNHYGLIGGVSRGDVGNFDLQGTSGPASLGINNVGQSIDLIFEAPVAELCFDLGTAFFSQLPAPPQVQITTFRDNQLISSQVVTIVDTLKNGTGTWYEQTFLNIDRVLLEPIAGRLLWAIDKLRIEDSCVNDTPPPEPEPPATGTITLVSVLFLLLD